MAKIELGGCKVWRNSQGFCEMEFPEYDARPPLGIAGRPLMPEAAQHAFLAIAYEQQSERDDIESSPEQLLDGAMHCYAHGCPSFCWWGSEVEGA